MQNPETFYLSAEDYRETTTVPTLINPMTGEEVEALLLETMVLIDAYIGSGWAPQDDEQEFIFPRSIDADVPRPITLATRMIADAILEERQKGVLPHQVASESSEGHSYSKKTQSESPFGFDVIPPSAFVFLDKYKRVGGRWAVEEPATL